MFRSMIHFAKDITGILIQSALNLWVTLGNNIFVTRLNLPIRKYGMSFLLHCCCCSVAKPCLTLCDPMDWAPQASLSFIISWSLLRLTSIELVMPSNHLILCCPLLLPPSIFPRITVFSKESALLIRWQNNGASVSASVLTTNIQDWFPLGLTGLISVLSRVLSRVFFSTTIWKRQLFIIQSSLPFNSHIQMTINDFIVIFHDYWKNHNFDYRDLCQQSNVSAFFFLH